MNPKKESKNKQDLLKINRQFPLGDIRRKELNNAKQREREEGGINGLSFY